MAQRARAQQEELAAASATVMRHAVDTLHALVKACLKKDEMMPVRCAYNS